MHSTLPHAEPSLVALPARQLDRRRREHRLERGLRPVVVGDPVRIGPVNDDVVHQVGVAAHDVDACDEGVPLEGRGRRRADASG
ncbi:MAG: hypothetical protein ABR500_09765 [Dermatophilaceae bacterium]|nr:hypothetical protein [Intrasporangiaceae bacterium]